MVDYNWWHCVHPGRAQKWSGLTPMTANMVGNQVCIRYATANCIQTDDIQDEFVAKHTGFQFQTVVLGMQLLIV